MHVLVVAFQFPPTRLSGVYRGLAIVNEIARRGHDVTVLTADTELFPVFSGVDESLMGAINSRVEVIRVPFPLGRQESVINRWPEMRAEHKNAWADETHEWEFGIFPEERFAQWRPRLDAAAYRLHRQKPVDLAIATGNPYVAYSPLMMLAAEFEVPYVLDDRDGWVIHIMSDEERWAESSEWLELLQVGCLEQWYTNPSLVEYHRDRFPSAAERIYSVRNGWDSRDLQPAELSVRSGVAKNFTFIGTVPPYFPWPSLIDGWRLAKQRGLDPNAKLQIIGGLGYLHGGAEHRRYLDESAADGVEYLGLWPRGDIQGAYDQADVMVFPLDTGPMHTACKVYEYLASGRPIAGFTSTDSDSRQIVNASPRSHVASSTEPEDFARSLLEAAADFADGDGKLRLAAIEYGAQFERDTVLNPAISRILSKAAQ